MPSKIESMSINKEMLELLTGSVTTQKISSFVRGLSRFFKPNWDDLSNLVDQDFGAFEKIGELELPDGSKVLVIGAQSKSEVSEKVSKTRQYDIARKTLRQTGNLQFDAGIFFFYDSAGSIRVSLIYAESDGNKRHWSAVKRFTYLLSPRLTNKTFISQVASKQFSGLQEIKDAFSIAAVTDLFYAEFYNHFQSLVDSVKANGLNDKLESKRDFVLLFAIRTIFLGFVQKKKWVGADENFLLNYLKKYQNSNSAPGSFYGAWLKPLFFQSLNTPSGTNIHLPPGTPEQVLDALLETPYLNGGLFREKVGYDDQGFYLEDKSIAMFFEFLFSHSFTIEENSRIDEDLQLNPEFLGIIFERIVNKENGAVYTPRTEVDLMCRMSLLEWLSKSVRSSIAEKNLFELIFPEQFSEDDQKFGSFSRNEALEILENLESVTVCDPAVGSGAFLVGMLQVIDDVEQSLRLRFDLPSANIYLRKKQIIGNSLYGVDIKEWAVWICQLRLWLSLFIDAEDDLKNSVTPILPSLDFKVRAGDSLVQQVGSVSFPLSVNSNSRDMSYTNEIQIIQDSKRRFFENDQQVTEESITDLEISFYAKIAKKEIESREKTLKTLGEKPNLEVSLFGDDETSKTKDKTTQNKIFILKKEIANLKDIARSLLELRPFVWSIEFAEVFIARGGFDIVIGNPPYVRQEKIDDPYGKVSSAEYKNLLKEMCILDFPEVFKTNKVSSKSDLYVYFYIRSLRLLNPQGVHVFICSNSWLDVEYGARLQEFLLKHFRILSVIDNHARRSFSAAAVNTVISMITTREQSSNDSLRFIGFKKPFEEVAFSEVLSKIYSEHETYEDDDARVVVVSEQTLLSNEQPQSGDGVLISAPGEYKFSKWGSKYLSQSNVLQDFLSKDHQPLRYLYDFVADSKRNTLEVFADQKPRAVGAGTMDFLKSVKDVTKISLDHLDMKYSIEATPEEIKNMRRPDIISNRFVGDRFFFIEGGEFAVSDTFFALTLKPGQDRKFFLALLNSTLSILSTEVTGRKNMGEGVLLIYGSELRELQIPNPDLFNGNQKKKLLDVYKSLSKRPVMSLANELGLQFDGKSEFNLSGVASDRYALDSIVFEALGLNVDEQIRIYETLLQLVSKRLSKSQSM